MNIFEAIFLGIVQGVSEFLPISSSGHLVLFENMFKIGNPEQYMTFNLLLHLGSLVAVFIAFWADIKAVLTTVWNIILNIFGQKRKIEKSERKLVVLLIISLVPMVIMLPFKGFIESMFHSAWIASACLLLTGVLLNLADKTAAGEKSVKGATTGDAFGVGVMQALAICPGLSRSGATITGGLLTGFTREFAVKFSFLMSIPTILGAVILEIPDVIKTTGESPGNLVAYIIGAVAAGVSGYFAIKMVRYIAKSGKFGGFAIYCYIAGCIGLVYSLIDLFV